MTKTASEREIDLRFHVHLEDAWQFIFNRLLDCDDAPLHRIDRAQKAIQRSRFSAAGRAGEQNDSVRLGEQFANRPLLFLAQIETLEAEVLAAAAEQSQADRFAVHRRNRGNANVDLLIARLQ